MENDDLLPALNREQVRTVLIQDYNVSTSTAEALLKGRWFFQSGHTEYDALTCLILSFDLRSEAENTIPNDVFEQWEYWRRVAKSKREAGAFAKMDIDGLIDVVLSSNAEWMQQALDEWERCAAIHLERFGTALGAPDLTGGLHRFENRVTRLRRNVLGLPDEDR